MKNLVALENHTFRPLKYSTHSHLHRALRDELLFLHVCEAYYRLFVESLLTHHLP